MVHAYACTTIHVFMHISMHVTTGSKPQHVKTMNVLTKYPARKPSRRYCTLGNQQGHGLGHETEQHLILPFVPSFFSPRGSVSRKNQDKHGAALVCFGDILFRNLSTKLFRAENPRSFSTHPISKQIKLRRSESSTGHSV